MSDTENKIPEWAEKEARRRLTAENKRLHHRGPFVAEQGWADYIVIPLAEMIAKHEQPPVDKFEVALNTAMNIIYSAGVQVTTRQRNYVNWDLAIERMKRIINES